MIDYFSMLFNDNFSHFIAMSACALCGKLTDFIKEREGGEGNFQKISFMTSACGYLK